MSAKRTAIAAVIALSGLCWAQVPVQDCPDGQCSMPAKPGEGRYAVYSPVGKSNIQMIKQGPRLNTLDGKTIAIVGGSFMAYVTHPELKRLILKKYPKATVYVLSEVGSAGPWPGPGVVREQKDRFVAKLKELRWMPLSPATAAAAFARPRRWAPALPRSTRGCPPS